MTELLDLALQDGAYQDIIINGETILTGWRDCQKRWSIIEPYIKPNQSLIDIGSHFGYFGVRISETFPSNFVWSIEADSRRAEIQALQFVENTISTVVVSHHTLTLNDLISLVRTCETFDTILCLSTIHYFPPEEIPQVLWLFGQIAPNLIIEFPSPLETDVANKSVVDSLSDPMRILGRVYDSVQIIGSVSSPKHPDIQRTIYLAQNYSITRDHCVPYLKSQTGRLHTVTFESSRWNIDKNPIMYRGLNLAHLKQFHLIYPHPEHFIKEAAERYKELITMTDGYVTDIHPRNIIVTADGSFPIDYLEGTGVPIYGKSWEEYSDCIKDLSLDSLETELFEKYMSDSVTAVCNTEVYG